MDVKQRGEIYRPCAVVWQLLFLLLEIVGGRLCSVEQVMTCGENKPKKQEHTTNLEAPETFGSVWSCSWVLITIMAACVDAMLEE